MKRSKKSPFTRWVYIGLFLVPLLGTFIVRRHAPEQLNNWYAFIGVEFAAIFVWMVIQDLVSGEIKASRNGVTMTVKRKESPVSYWSLIGLAAIGSAWFGFLAIYRIRAEVWDLETAKKYSLYFGVAAIIALCLHILADTWRDIQTGEINRNTRGSRLIRRDDSSNRYWVVISIKLVCVAAFTLVAIMAIISRS